MPHLGLPDLLVCTVPLLLLVVLFAAALVAINVITRPVREDSDDQPEP